MSIPRQTRWSQKIREMGLCFCGQTTNGKSLCAEHLKKQAIRMRAFHARNKVVMFPGMNRRRAA